jgi:hypothetical protein
MVKPAEVRAEDAHHELTRLRRLIAEQEQRRSAAIAELVADGWSLQRIAHLLGVSKARVAQIVR